MENKSYTCRFCDSKVPIINSTYNCILLTFDGDVLFMGSGTDGQTDGRKVYKNPRNSGYSPK